MAKTPKTTTAPTGSIAPFGLRMLPELRAKVEESAKVNGRSMNAEVVSRIETSYKLESTMDLVLDQAKQIKELRNKVMESNFVIAQAFQVLSGIDDDRDACIRALSEMMQKTSGESLDHFKALLNEHLELTGQTPEEWLKKVKADVDESRLKNPKT